MEQTLRRQIITACQKTNDGSTSGNISARWQDGFIITPSGVPYEELSADDLICLRLLAPEWPSTKKPSSEWRIHRDIYAARPDGAVVHTHSTYATALAIAGMDLPAVHYMIAVSGGHTIRCAPYATYGTQELSDNALRALDGRTCCLLANHGVIATGPSLTKAVWLANEVETLAEQYCLSRQIGEPKILPNDEIYRVMSKFKTYGKA